MIKAKNLEQASRNTKILIAPLDWGLGHTTRCIPIIRQLIKQNIQVFIASDKHNYSLLKEEFPSAVFLRYKGYGIEYSRKRNSFLIKLLFQLPKVVLHVFRENRWLKKTVKRFSIDGVISDNRFGMYSRNIPSVYITHQLHIETGNRFLNKIAAAIHYFFIKNYSQCWVPDFKENGLAGKLSHPNKIPKNVSYIGPLSRFKNLPASTVNFDLLISISGPEPQRTIFEKKILFQLKKFPGKAILVRGLPSDSNKIENFNQVQIENHLSSDRLNLAIEQSKIIISRGGYTSIMDFALLKKQAVLVPTPGQLEQEYLCRYLLSKKYFLAIQQEKFELEDALKKAAQFDFQPINFPNEIYQKTVNEFVLSLKSANFASQ